VCQLLWLQSVLLMPTWLLMEVYLYLGGHALHQRLAELLLYQARQWLCCLQQLLCCCQQQQQQQQVK
jgi:hypothetical protein